MRLFIHGVKAPIPAPRTKGRVDENILQEITRQIVERFGPEKVILFGSHAWGDPGEHSDVDLLVVIDTTEPTIELETRMALSCRPPFVPMDILVRTPQEVVERLQKGDFFLRRIVEKGRILYERCHAPGVDQ